MKYEKGKNPNSRNGFKKGNKGFRTKESYQNLKYRQKLSKWQKGKPKPKPSKKSRLKMSLAKKGKMPKNINQIAGWNKGKPAPWTTAENHWKWIKDRTQLKKDNKRGDSAGQNWVKQIKKRDKQCQLKNENCDGYLVVHHIKSWAEYPDLRYELTNGITLCQAHHPRKRAEEIQMIPRLSALVGNNV